MSQCKQAIWRTTLLSFVGWALTGCSSLSPDPERSFFGGGGDRVNAAGAHQLLDAAFESVDLVELLVPGGLSSEQQAYCQRHFGDSEAQAACRIDVAFQVLHQRPELDIPARWRIIQDRLIAASDQRCNVYMIYIQRHRSAATFSLGTLTSLFGGAAAIATGANVARALGGSAGILSGIRAEYEQSYFLNQTTNIIAAGIRTRRKLLLDEIDKGRTGAVEQRYTAERAVSDALRYHGACSLLSGLEQASITVNAQAGLETSLKAIEAVHQHRLKVKAEEAAQAASAAQSATSSP